MCVTLHVTRVHAPRSGLESAATTALHHRDAQRHDAVRRLTSLLCFLTFCTSRRACFFFPFYICFLIISRYFFFFIRTSNGRLFIFIANCTYDRVCNFFLSFFDFVINVCFKYHNCRKEFAFLSLSYPSVSYRFLLRSRSYPRGSLKDNCLSVVCVAFAFGRSSRKTDHDFSNLAFSF